MDASAILERAYASQTPDQISDVTNLSDELGKEDFLKLLVTQLQNQDPLSPMDNQDMILQMAQFSTLEGTQNLNRNFTEFLGNSYMSSASNLIGKEVHYLQTDAEAGMKELSGIVSQVNIQDDDVTLTINGQEVLMSQITTIGIPAETPAAEAE